MPINVSKEQIRAARQVDLYEFLTNRHNGSFIREGRSIRPRNNHSISIKEGYAGYMDFATNEGGNPIEFLVNHMGYRFPDAVLALTGGTGAARAEAAQPDRTGNVPPEFPTPVDGEYKNLFAFLNKRRSIPVETIRRLISWGLLYQEKSHNNIVFINYERDFAELRGTYTYGEPFHGVVPNCRHDGFWYFRTSRNARNAYICEAAIDAVSLYELHRMQGNQTDAYYFSIAGAAKQPAIDRLKNSKLELTLAVDNDDAGQKCRDRNPGLACILPEKKDWNEDLQAR